MPSNSENQKSFLEAVAALEEIATSSDSTKAQRDEARRAIEKLATDFVGKEIAEIENRTGQFASFVEEMEKVLQRVGESGPLAAIARLKNIAADATALLGAEVQPAGAPARGRAGRAAAAEEKSAPKTTRPEARERRQREPVQTAAERMRRRLDALPDRIDVRDWFYQPTLTALPDQIVNCDLIPEILDQGREGACTGFALAAVINFLLSERRQPRRVSPRMLYEMARRYDEWPGESYEGSSARGAMKGWVAHGVCASSLWPRTLAGPGHLTPDRAEDAQQTPGGAYYRVMHKNIRDMHAALHEVGIIYATLMVHEGWDEPGPEKRTITYVRLGKIGQIDLPIIRRRGRADSGHAIAIVGYTHEGFIVQNSWGRRWGEEGFALLPYEDYLLHTTDVWVAQLGVPVSMDLWAGGYADTMAGFQRATATVPLADIRPYVVDVGNNGELSDSGAYWTTERDLERLFGETIPEATADWEKKRILLYLHGGLNDERTVAKRVVAFKDVLLENEIYPVHIMWESGVMESLKGMIDDLFTDVDERAGAIGDWLRKVREGLIEAKDRTFELTAAWPGTKLWGEMKENARIASRHPDKKGGMQLIAKHAHAAMKGLSTAERKTWELHVVGHSAGSIFAAYALPHLLGLGVSLKTLQLLAPAMTLELFKETLLPAVKAGRCPHPSLFILSDIGERDDTVGPYGKSLLYLVSNAFEARRDVPLLGMEKFLLDARFGDTEMRRLFAKKVDGLPSLVIAGVPGALGSISRSNTHGGFDNDPETLNSVLRRIVGSDPARPFTTRDLQY